MTTTINDLVGAWRFVRAVAATDLLRTRAGASDARARWTQSWPLLAGFIVGCLLGAGGAALLSDHAAVIPAVLAVALLVLVPTRGFRGLPPSPEQISTR